MDSLKAHVLALCVSLPSDLWFLIGIVCALPPMSWATRLALALSSSCPDTSSAAKMWRWETQCWRRRRERNLTNSSPRTATLRMTNAATANPTCSSEVGRCACRVPDSQSGDRIYCHDFTSWLC